MSNSGQKLPFTLEISERLEKLAAEMTDVATEMTEVATLMDYFGGFSEIAEHGRELAGAAIIARNWAKHIRGELHA